MSARPRRQKTSKGDTSKRFDVATLREFAGDKVFARGIDYNAQGQVEIVSMDRSRVLARVLGSEIYRSELKGAGQSFSGSCSCPAFSDWGFCKHLVATALAVNDLGPEAIEQVSKRLSKLRDHLRGKGIEALIDMIVKLAENDPDLFRNLQLASAVATSDDKTLFAHFKKAITEATRTHDYIEYREVAAWTEKIETLLEQIADLVADRAELVLRLLDHFFARMDQALQSMDDSDGQGGAVYAKACEIHLAACNRASPDPLALARTLFERETESDWDFFHGASEAYAEVLGEAGLAEYRRLASKAWQAIVPVRAGGPRHQDEQSIARYRLGAILDGFAEREGDFEARIAIRMKSLSSAYGYLEIAQLCLDNKRDAEALKWAEEGLWQFEDDPDERLVSFTADLYRHSGRRKEAAELLWRIFERHPSIDLYRRLKKSAGPAKAAVDEIRRRAIGSLQAKLGTPNTEWGFSSPRKLLLEVLTEEKLFAEAWKVVRDQGCSGPQLLRLANASERSHPDEALTVYAKEVERLAASGGQQNYAGANKLIEQMESIRKQNGQAAEHDIFLANFVVRHKAKRNLMKLLRTDAPGHSGR